MGYEGGVDAVPIFQSKPKYHNLDGVRTDKTFKDMAQWQSERRSKKKDLTYSIPRVEKIDKEFLHGNRTETSITWIGHATFLIQHQGQNILTDPVWARRMGFASRLSEPGMLLDDLPPIDVVLISHGHYDHLHIPSLRKLPGKPKMAVPAGLGKWLSSKISGQVIEANWWDALPFGRMEAVFVPAQHWTRRTLWDMNTSHWGGWIIREADAEDAKSIYYAGDSGYFRGFTEIGSRFTIGHTLMPIGAYEPEWFMGNQHVTPEEAVQAFQDCGGEVFVPMHYGAFRLADDTPREALDRLEAEWKRRQLPDDQLWIGKLGETRIID
jgi:L-ascorbate metabolism protein UlaG (beta-lactamase superfamily)